MSDDVRPLYIEVSLPIIMKSGSFNQAVIHRLMSPSLVRLCAWSCLVAPCAPSSHSTGFETPSCSRRLRSLRLSAGRPPCHDCNNNLKSWLLLPVGGFVVRRTTVHRKRHPRDNQSPGQRYRQRQQHHHCKVENLDSGKYFTSSSSISTFVYSRGAFLRQSSWSTRRATPSAAATLPSTARETVAAAARAQDLGLPPADNRDDSKEEVSRARYTQAPLQHSPKSRPRPPSSRLKQHAKEQLTTLAPGEDESRPPASIALEATGTGNVRLRVPSSTPRERSRSLSRRAEDELEEGWEEQREEELLADFDIGDGTVGGWLQFTPREIKIIQRKAPALRKESRLASRLGQQAHSMKYALGVLRGPQLGMTAMEVKSLVLRHPDLLAMGGAGPSLRLEWLEREIDMTQAELKKVVLKQPRLLSHSVKTTVEPTIKFLKDELGLTIPQISLVMQKFPEVFNLSVERSLIPKVKWLEDTLEMERAEVARMVTKLPVIFGYSIEDNIEPKIAWLQKALHASRATALRTMVKWPGLFTCSVERNLKPTMEYFCGELGGDPEEVRRLVIQNPRILGASIERRMRPRAARLKERGVTVRFDEHRWSLAVSTDEKFNELLRTVDAAADKRLMLGRSSS